MDYDGDVEAVSPISLQVECSINDRASLLLGLVPLIRWAVIFL